MGSLDDQTHCYQCVDAEVEARYERERQIQLKARGKISDIEIDRSDQFQSFARDLWRDETSLLETTRERLIQQRHHRVLIVGAGHGGLLFAARLIQTGQFSADDLVLVDTAAGFGGTWYWNRYPGLMCDTESYIYMPLLEESGYMPRHKYASGTEIRTHCERIAQLYNLPDRAIFRTKINHLDWEESQKHWMVSGIQLGVDDESQKPIQLSADFVMLASGAFASPRIPDFPNILDYQGKLFHTARWDYQYTGGTPEKPELTELRNKKVAIIGTGASAIQAVPQLAKFSQKLVVFQRTPSAVDQRNNQRTDARWWQEMIQQEGNGWQRRRMVNFNAFTCNEKPLPAKNLVADGWTEMPSFSLLIGGPQSLNPEYTDQMRSVDAVRQQKVRSRVHDLVPDSNSAGILTPWYPGWCKRPCFHDDYLAAFNQSNVELVDIRHHGISHFTSKGLVVDGVEHELDAVILSTGYTVPVTRHSPGSRADITVTGRQGQTMEDKWNNGLATLHGVMARGLPNLFFTGSSQAGACVNLTYVLDETATHVAYILSKAVSKCSSLSQKVVMEPTTQAEEGWAHKILARAAGLRGIAGCTPGYLNGYGMSPTSMSVEDQMKSARLAPWGEGVASYVLQLEAWRANGKLDGIELTYFS
jgi:cation diffusion facilitator CzcD-associated flavoprotein CzcO